MTPLVYFMMGEARPPTPDSPYIWMDGGSGNRSVPWTNPNTSPMTLTMSVWDAGKVSWVTSSPVTIAGKGTASLVATKAISTGVIVYDLALVSWACQGSHGIVTAEASYYEP